MRKRLKGDARLQAGVSFHTIAHTGLDTDPGRTSRRFGRGAGFTVAGFTLIELLIALTVVAILTTIAIPSLADLIRRNRIAVANNDLVAAFQHARAEALNRGRPVTVCPTLDQAACANQADWSVGWLIAIDNNTTGAPNLQQILQVGEASAPSARTIAEAGTSHFRFAPTGQVEWGVAGGVERAIRVDAPGCENQEARRVIVNRIGRVRSEPAPCA